MSEFYPSTIIQFIAEESPTTSTVRRCEGDTWKEQADTFFEFLLGQGFILSEATLAEHYEERAGDMGDFRSNLRNRKVEEEYAVDETDENSGV